MVNATSAASTFTRPDREAIWSWLHEIPDPEIPAISITDLGIVRDVAWSADEPDICVVTITPTYSACPATAVIERLICDALQAGGVRTELQIRLSPPWTTAWISEEGREKLRGFGIAPPARRGEERDSISFPVLIQASQPRIACPRCGSQRITIISQFGSTLCKALYRCDGCLEPFDYFKRH